VIYSDTSTLQLNCVTNRMTYIQSELLYIKIGKNLNGIRISRILHRKYATNLQEENHNFSPTNLRRVL